MGGGVRRHDSVNGESGAVLSDGPSLCNCVAYSPDGLQIATDGTGNGVKIWNVGSGLVEFVLDGHTRDVKTVAFSPCGKWIATGSDDKTVRLWEASSGKPGLVLSDQTDWVRNVSFSPNGQQIASGNDDGLAIVWDVNTGKPQLLENRGEDRVRCVAFSLLDTHVLAVCTGRVVRLWDVQNEKVQRTLEHEGDDECLSFSTCGQWMAVGSGASVWLWNRTPDGTKREWRHRKTITGFFGHVMSISGGLRRWSLLLDVRVASLEFGGCRATRMR